MSVFPKTGRGFKVELSSDTMGANCPERRRLDGMGGDGGLRWSSKREQPDKKGTNLFGTGELELLPATFEKALT